MRAKDDPATMYGARQVLIGLVVPALAFLLQLEIAYALVPRLCPDGPMIVAHLLALVMLMATVAAAIYSWRSRVPATGEGDASDESRGRFLGNLGVLIGALVAVGEIFLWLPLLFHNPCQR